MRLYIEKTMLGGTLFFMTNGIFGPAVLGNSRYAANLRST